MRFIEYMDVGTTNGWRLDEVVTAAEIVERIGAEFPLEPVDPNYAGEVAERWRYRDGAGEIGVIASVTQAVLRRLHARAPLRRRPALHLPVRDDGHDLRGLAARRRRRRDARARDLARSGARAPTATRSCARAATPRERRIEMSYIGG